MSFEAERRVYDYLERLNLLASGRVDGAERSRWVADVRRRIEIGREEYGTDEIGTARAIEQLGDPVKLLDRELTPRMRHRGPAPAPRASGSGAPGSPPAQPAHVSVPAGAPTQRSKRQAVSQTIGTSPVVTDPFRSPETARTLLPTKAEARSALSRVRPLDAIAVVCLAVGGLLFPTWVVGAVLTGRSRALRYLDKLAVQALLIGGGLIGLATSWDEAAPENLDGFGDLPDIDLTELLSGAYAGLTIGGLLAAGYYGWRIARRKRPPG